MLSLEESLKILKKTNALIEGHFILSSGLHSPKYVQCAQLMSKPHLAHQLCSSLSQKIEKEFGKFDIIFDKRISKSFLNYFSSAISGSSIYRGTSFLKDKLNKKFTSNNSALITRERHRVKLNDCLKEIDKFLKKDQNKDLELAAEDLRMATRHLGSIVGKVDVEEILGSIFKDFCIGK